MRRATALVTLFLLLPIQAALAHGGNYAPPPPPPRGGAPRNPSDPGADPVTSTPDDVVRGPATPGDWSRWWTFQAPRFLGEDAEPRAAAPEALRNRIVATLLRLVDDPNEDIATACLIALGKDGDPAHVPAVLRCLGASARPAAVRESAALASGLLRGSDASEPVLVALRKIASDPSAPERLRACAVAALGLRGDGAAKSSVLLRLARDPAEPPDVRAASISALGLIGGDDAFNVVLKVAHEEPGAAPAAVVRTYACQAIARCGGTEAARALRVLTGDGDAGVRRAAALGLAEAAGAADDDTQRVLAALATRDPEREVRAAALLALGRQGHAKCRTTLESAWKQRDDLSPFAALGLGLLARRSGDPGLAACLRGAPDSKEALDLRGAALIALGLARDLSTLDAACRTASGSVDATLQCRAADCLALLRDGERGAEALRRLLANAKDPLLQRHAAEALGRLGGPAAGEDLVRALRSSAGLFVRAEAASSLGRIGGVPAMTELIGLLEDERQPGLLRAMAAVGLGIALDRSGGRRLARLGEDLDWARLTGTTEELLSIL